jgi:uncharacterized Ntn-hydrolase superfamily protein
VTGAAASRHRCSSSPRAAGTAAATTCSSTCASDDHVAPCVELERLLDLHHVYFEPPSADALVPMRDVAADIDRWLVALGYPDLDAWLGVENFEMRVVDGKIDRYVLEVLERQASGASAP